MVLAVLLVALGGGAYFYSQTAPQSAQPAPIVATAAPVSTARPGEVSVRVTEAELTEQLNTQVGGKPLGDTPLGPATARDFSVKLQNGQVRTTGTAQISGASAPIEIAGTVQAAGGRPVVSVSDAKVSGVSLPSATRQQIERAMQERVDATVKQRGITVTSVTVANGEMTLTGSPS
ncbi:MAG: hypothetical protein HYX52_02350 [Chloroflexi bacterium]|nr:hypothetical protein [Chloroflexota bacterium]